MTAGSPRCFHALAASLLLLLFSGCRYDIDSHYGQRSGVHAPSVNGTSVLADMFSEAGNRVSSTSVLSPRIAKKADVIVWFPDDFELPSAKARGWMKTWLNGSKDRTLIYVGRDYEASAAYWKACEAGASPTSLPEIQFRKSEREAEFQARRKDLPKSAHSEWFRIDGQAKTRPVRSLAGQQQWTDGVDSKQLGIELHSRLLPAKGGRVLLSSEGDALVLRQRVGQSKVVVVANGSFLLNLPLVNHEHRKLAGTLIDQVGANRRVVFLESGPDGPPIFEQDPDNMQRNGLEIFGIAPFDTILLQLAVVGVIFCFARLPIFGRPGTLDSPHTADFGKHIWAFGKLLERTRDRAFAQARIGQFQHPLHKGPKARQGASNPLPPAESTTTSEKPPITPQTPSTQSESE
jgi:hypothetical protein